MLATTTPYDLVKPLADALGFDDVVATRYGGGRTACTTARSTASSCGAGKLRAIAEWAMENAVDLGESWAYSDSYYDIPMLSPWAPRGGEPRPADARHRAAAALAGRAPRRAAGVPKLPVLNVEPQRRLLALARPELIPYARFDITGVEHLPKGAAIVVGNHRSYFDPMAMGLALAKRGRPCASSARRRCSTLRSSGQLARAMGGIRVERGTGSDEPLAGRRGPSRRARWWR